MLNKVFVKTKAPILVRLYNFFLLFCGKTDFIKYEVDCLKYLKMPLQLSKKGRTTKLLKNNCYF